MDQEHTAYIVSQLPVTMWGTLWIQGWFVKYYEIIYKIKLISSTSSYKNVARPRLYSVKFTYYAEVQ